MQAAQTATMLKPILFLAVTGWLATAPAIAQEQEAPAGMSHQHMMMHHGDMGGSEDNRQSLGLVEPMRTNHLTRMREHLKAVDEIISLIADEEFGKASDIAHTRLGLTPDMQKMCTIMGNEEFQNIGIAFHQSADELGEVLKTRNAANSLKALHRTMQFCISCHQSFRQ